MLSPIEKNRRGVYADQAQRQMTLIDTCAAESSRLRSVFQWPCHLSARVTPRVTRPGAVSFCRYVAEGVAKVGRGRGRGSGAVTIVGGATTRGFSVGCIGASGASGVLKGPRMGAWAARTLRGANSLSSHATANRLTTTIKNTKKFCSLGPSLLELSSTRVAAP